MSLTPSVLISSFISLVRGSGPNYHRRVIKVLFFITSTLNCLLYSWFSHKTNSLVCARLNLPIVLVVKETLKIGSRLPKTKCGRGRVICDSRDPWTCKQEASWMSAVCLWNWNHFFSLYNTAKCIEFHNCYMVCCEVTGGLSASQITSQWTLWSSMISVSWATNCFQAIWACQEPGWCLPSDTVPCTYIFVCFQIPLNTLQ